MEVTQCRIGQHVLVHELAQDAFVAPISSIEQTLVRVWMGNHAYAAPIRFVTLALRPLHNMTYYEGIELFKLAFDSDTVEDFELNKNNPYALVLSGNDCFGSESIGKVLELKSDTCSAYYSEENYEERFVCPFNARSVFNYLDKIEIDSGGLIEANLAVDIIAFRKKQ